MRAIPLACLLAAAAAGPAAAQTGRATAAGTTGNTVNVLSGTTGTTTSLQLGSLAGQTVEELLASGFGVTITPPGTGLGGGLGDTTIVTPTTTTTAVDSTAAGRSFAAAAEARATIADEDLLFCQIQTSLTLEFLAEEFGLEFASSDEFLRFASDMFDVFAAQRVGPTYRSLGVDYWTALYNTAQPQTATTTTTTTAGTTTPVTTGGRTTGVTTIGSSNGVTPTATTTTPGGTTVTPIANPGTGS